MKTKLVLWGTDKDEKRVLIALELRPKDNKVNIYTFPESIATEDFANQMLNEWRNDQEVVFPEGYTTSERELSVTEGLLPDDLKVERGDIVQRAQTEWHFVVLSSKLNAVYQAELAELKEKIDQLTSYDSKAWDGLKSFWSKVQGQVRDRNLFRDHANTLRDNTNALFSRLKELRSTLDQEFQELSGKQLNSFMSTLEEVEDRISNGLNLSGVFDELKQLQRQFRDTKFTREHRTKVWERLDNAFKLVKEKKFGPGANADSSPLERLQRRYNGLLAAIEKMERSIKRDRDDLSFQDRKIANTDGQLEAQIRQAKIKMIEERVRSKEEKLNEMHKTKSELEKRIESQKVKDAKRAEQEKLLEAKRAAKEKIQDEIKQAEKNRSENSEKLEKAAEAISSSKGKKEDKEKKEKKTETLSDIAELMKDAFEDAVDTAKAVAVVMSDKVEEVVTEVKEIVEDVVTEIKEEVNAEAPADEPAATTITEMDDLKAVEGIGPKIEEILNKGNIHTYAQLAATEVDAIKTMLAEAGGRYKNHNPTTWPRQAKMAADGQWDELKVWQDELDGGKEVTASSEEE